MGRARQLYELQEIDLDIEGKEQMLRSVESQIGENKALADARVELDRDLQLLSELGKEQQWMELEIEDLREKLNVIENKQYSGTVESPKELTNLQRAVEQLKAQQSKREDRILEMMEQVETVRGKTTAKGDEIKQFEQKWQRNQKQLSAQQAELTAALSVLKRRRDDLRSRIDPGSFELYQTLRQKKHSIAVSRIEQGICQGCRISLPMTDIQRARIASELVQCSSCRRILYLE